jgi:serine protease Do
MLVAMRRLRVLAVVALVWSCAGSQGQGKQAQAPLTPKDIVQRASPAIVRIEAGQDRVGTGFTIDKSGVIATNLHVVVGESTIKIHTFDGGLYQVSQIVGYDADHDLALLRIQPKKDLPILKLGDSDAMVAGDQIVTIGNPLGVFDYTVTEGLISQVRRDACVRRDESEQRCLQYTNLLQISAAISPGSSGGPLFNQFGEVVGVTTAITSGQNLNIAMPGNYLKPMVAHYASISPDKFAEETRRFEEGPPRRREDKDGQTKEIVRRVPVHELAVLDGCKLEDIEEIVHQIGETIENGAPLYNKGEIEACFRIYEGTSLKYEHDGACPGVRTAFGDGLLRANSLASYKEKAWALRDTFDGLIDVAYRWAQAHPPGSPTAPAPAKPKKK